jgi:rhodanese-related sulfurtransferase
MHALVIAVLVAAVPAARGEIPVVDAAVVHGHLVRGDAVLVDARSTAEFEKAHIAGAINIPAERTKADAARLPRDRRTPVIFYCRGMG